MMNCPNGDFARTSPKPRRGRGGRSATADSLISHCPASPGQAAVQNFGNGIRPNWVGSRPSLRRSRGDTPYLLDHGDEDKDPRKKTKNPTTISQSDPVCSRRDMPYLSQASDGGA